MVARLTTARSRPTNCCRARNVRLLPSARPRRSARADRLPRSPASQHADRVGERGRRGKNPSSRRGAEGRRRHQGGRQNYQARGDVWVHHGPALRSADVLRARRSTSRSATTRARKLCWNLTERRVMRTRSSRCCGLGIARSTSPTTRKVGSSEWPLPAARGPRNAR